MEKHCIVFKDFHLYCAHSVQAFGPDHKCSRTHGHTYRIRVNVTSPIDSETGISVPFDDIEKAWQVIGAPLDHTCLNDHFGDNATTEVLAVYLHEGMERLLSCPCSVEVRETESSGVIVS